MHATAELPASRGRSRGSSCYSLVTPATEQLWLEQPPQHDAIYTTPGTPFPAPWPPRSPQTRRELRRVLELPSDLVPTAAWADAPSSSKAAAHEALQPGKRKAPLRLAGRSAPEAAEYGHAGGGRSLLGGSAPGGSFNRPAFLSRPCSEDPTASPFYFKISGGSMHPMRLHDSPLSGTRPPSTYAADRPFLASPALSTRPGSQMTKRDFWSRPESRPPAVMLRSAGCMKAGITAAVGSTGASASDAAIAAAALAWDLAPPLQQEPVSDMALGAPLKPLRAPLAPWRRLEEATAKVHSGLGRVVRRTEPHKAETEQWARGGKAVPAAVERQRRHMSLPLLSPQTLSDWELLLEPSRRQLMSHLHEVSNVLKMPPRSTVQPSPAASGPPLRGGIDDSPELEPSFLLDDAGTALPQPWQPQQADDTLSQGDEPAGIAAEHSLAREPSTASERKPSLELPVPAPSPAFHEEFRRLHQQLQQQHGVLPPLVSKQSDQQQLQQGPPVAAPDAEMDSGDEASGNNGVWHEQQQQQLVVGQASASQESRPSSVPLGHPAGRSRELSLAQQMPDGNDEHAQRHVKGHEGNEPGWPGWNQMRELATQLDETHQAGAPAQAQHTEQDADCSGSSSGLGAQGWIRPSLSVGDQDEAGVMQASQETSLSTRPSFLGHFTTDPLPQLWPGSPVAAQGTASDATASSQQQQQQQQQRPGSEAAAPAPRGGSPASVGTGFRFSAAQGFSPVRAQSGEQASRAQLPDHQPSTQGDGIQSRDSRQPGPDPEVCTADGTDNRAEAGGDDHPADPANAHDATGQRATSAGSIDDEPYSDDADADAELPTDTSNGDAPDLPRNSQASIVESIRSAASDTIAEQSPVKTSGIGYTVVKSVQVWQPDHEEQLEAARLQQLEQLEQELGDEDQTRAAKLRAGSRAAKALHKQLGEGELALGSSSAAPLAEGASMLRLAPASRRQRGSGPGTDRPDSASSAPELPQQSSMRRPASLTLSSPSFKPLTTSSSSMSRHSQPRPGSSHVNNRPASSHRIVGMTTKDGQSADTQSIWTE